MLKNHLFIALRLIWRNKLHTLISVFGLATAVTCCIILFMYLQYEWTWNKSHENSDRIFRVFSESHYKDYDPMYSSNAPTPFFDTVNGQIPGVISLTRASTASRVLRINGQQLVEAEGLFVEDNVFQVFSFPLLEGNPETALQNPNSVVITQSYARKLFGTDDVMGKVIEIRSGGNYLPLEITGVSAKIPSNSTLNGDIFFPMQVYLDRIKEWGNEHWGACYYETYMFLEENADYELVGNTLQQYLTDLGITITDSRKIYFALQPFETLYMEPPFQDNPKNFMYTTDSTASGILLSIALVVIIIACINVTTLSIGRSVTRSREVGVRKVLGAHKPQLISLFWLETVLLTLFALLIGIGFSEMLVPVLQNLSVISFEANYTPVIFISLIGLWGLMTIMSGLYPAMVATAFPVIASMKGSLRLAGKSRLRKTLVFFQFACAIALVAITLTMGNQIRYINKVDLGFNSEQVVMFPVHSGDKDGETAVRLLRDKTAGFEGIEAISGSSCMFGEGWTTLFGNYEGESFILNVATVDDNFISTMEIDIVLGRDFSIENPSDFSRGMIVNEAFIEKIGKQVYGWENVIGQTVPGYGDNEIIGVMNDFHIYSMHDEINPLAIIIDPMVFFSVPVSVAMSHSPYIEFIYVRLAPEHIQESIKEIKSVWNEISPDWPFDYKFVDSMVQQQYEQEMRWNQIVSLVSILTIIIAVAGLLGLTVLQINQRKKEIGIRKVLGAESARIVYLLTRETAILILAANAIALPVTWIIMNRWLEKFVYKVSINPWLLISAGFIALIIAIGTIGSLAWKAANINPSDTLRYE